MARVSEAVGGGQVGGTFAGLAVAETRQPLLARPIPRDIPRNSGNRRRIAGRGVDVGAQKRKCRSQKRNRQARADSIKRAARDQVKARQAFAQLEMEPGALEIDLT